MRNSHTKDNARLLRKFTTALFGLGAALSFLGAWKAGPALAGLSVDKKPDSGRGPAYYAHYTLAALEAGESENALLSARAETTIAPDSADAWQRRAQAAVSFNDGPDREALASLIEAYRLDPFPSPRDMVWRVEFAARHEVMMPNVLMQATLAQIAVLERMPSSYERRRQWCRDFPDGTIAEAVCATTPGVWRNGVQQGVSDES
ncbi:hypothetical protein [Parvularcula marina]|uniref:Uncharacterized protein n=1 Tax=Parvularcula marina TaxID=2292771 RepID=A0A371RH48_9PROT|nr:hypothetical protein [Parvularcula marina]RFB04787.1 hypothetical protein DX908_05525 [Parvularcula marina]